MLGRAFDKSLRGWSFSLHNHPDAGSPISQSTVTFYLFFLSLEGRMERNSPNMAMVRW